MLLVFGSINVDLLFRVPALPRPGETVLCSGYEVAPGGKGANQAAAAAKAGARVRFAGHVGDDGFGPVARRALVEAGVDDSGLLVSPRRRPTGVAVIGVDPRGENQITVASGANLDARPNQIADGELGPGVTMLCQNEIPPEATFGLLLRARARGARTVLNLAPAGAVPGEVLDALDVLVVNEPEAAAAAGGAAAAAAGPEALARRLAERHGLTCVVTLGAAGALAVGPGGGNGGLRVGALPVAAVDTTGAGDAFVGVLAAGLDGGLTLSEALRRAAVAAGLACEAVGAQTGQPRAAAIEARLAELPPPTPLG